MKLLSHFDFAIIIPAIILLCLSLIVLSSISGALFMNQLLFSVLGIGCLIFFSSLGVGTLKNFKLPFYIVSLLLLALPFFIGPQVRGAQRWIDIGGFRIQFSELLKPFLIVSFASLLSGWGEKLTFPRIGLGIVLFIPVVLLLVRQPDLGNAIVYTATFIFMFFIAGMSVWYILSGFIFFAISIPIAWNRLALYQKNRIFTFINPSYDPLGIGYNAIQSAIAVGSGLLLGRGLGRGIQSQLAFLPERHTDFIFATFSEEFGFLGSAVVLILYFLLLLRLLKIAKECDDVFASLVAYGVFILILSQVFINVGMNLRLIPITGVTLPLLSYGGSSLVGTLILLGLVCAIGKTIKKKERTLEIR